MATVSIASSSSGQGTTAAIRKAGRLLPTLFCEKPAGRPVAVAPSRCPLARVGPILIRAVLFFQQAFLHRLMVSGNMHVTKRHSLHNRSIDKFIRIKP